MANATKAKREGTANDKRLNDKKALRLNYQKAKALEAILAVAGVDPRPVTDKYPNWGKRTFTQNGKRYPVDTHNSLGNEAAIRLLIEKDAARAFPACVALGINPDNYRSNPRQTAAMQPLRDGNTPQGGEGAESRKVAPVPKLASKRYVAINSLQRGMVVRYRKHGVVKVSRVAYRSPVNYGVRMDNGDEIMSHGGLLEAVEEVQQ